MPVYGSVLRVVLAARRGSGFPMWLCQFLFSMSLGYA